ncbi:hypothetical protein ACSMFQ_23660 [Ectopseudomonas chengduensis]|nr:MULTISPECIES: hypothetical protein [Pseudomonas]KJU75643.1 hypothetical protein N619_23355 [Pseudomonas oleovorans]MDZ4194728.1 hypothetical protein [Pseudomonas sp.]WFS18946.1 hypothetical protein P9K38_01020 [Pseudomonas sp. 905_Psudmo1]WKC39157.1 hypothetical protein QYM18_08705 [Pseudomonas chengduensis]
MVIKVDTQLPVVTALDPQARRPVQGEQPLQRQRKQLPAEPAPPPRGKSATFNLQLNQQLTSMQAADSYLGELAGRLGQLKLSLSRELSNAQAGERDGIKRELEQVRKLLAERSQRSGETLDASFKLRLSEPVRSRFSLQGLDSIAAVQQAGKETLLFSAGRKLAEPLAVVLDEGLSEQQILRRFNAGLGPAGIRAEVDHGGALKFSARESEWQQLKGELRVQGEGKLASQAQAVVVSHEEQMLRLPEAARLDGARELRRALDEVVAALDRIGTLREQLSHRQEEIRDFLARHADHNEREWAKDFAGEVFSLMRRSPSSYAAVTQTVVAQANISRSSVVSLLS